MKTTISSAIGGGSSDVTRANGGGTRCISREGFGYAVKAGALLAALALSGCSATLGALCYIPAKTTGQCSATTVQPGVEPAAGG
jgi:hypothetical protein